MAVTHAESATDPEPSPEPSLADGLRSLADLVEAHPKIAERIGWGGGLSAVFIANSPDEMAMFSRMIGGHRQKEGSDEYLRVRRNLGGGVDIRVIGEREQVCTRRVVGTETVEVPAVEAQEARTETREIIEWDCAPVLGGGE